MKQTQYIALGSNLASSLGGPEQIVRLALEKLASAGAEIRAMSVFYNTPAFPVGNGPDYVNAVAEVRANWTPQQTLAQLHAVEQEMGRVRGERWATRTLDLDLIASGDKVLPDVTTHAWWRDLSLAAQMEQTPAQLILPHPRMQDRAFVLVPMADIAPDWIHPVLGLNVRQMLDALPQALKDEVRAL